jgi:hypothetical protein
MFSTLDAYCGIPTLKPKSIIDTTINRRWENAVFWVKNNQQIMHATTDFKTTMYKLMQYQQFVGIKATINL